LWVISRKMITTDNINGLFIPLNHHRKMFLSTDQKSCIHQKLVSADQ
jgi:hypothetical protein